MTFDIIISSKTNNDALELKKPLGSIIKPWLNIAHIYGKKVDEASAN